MALRPYMMKKTQKRVKTRKTPGQVKVKDINKDVQRLKIWHKLERPEITELIRNSVVTGTANVTTAGAVHSMTALSSTNRKGLEITWKSIKYKGYLRWGASSAGGLVTLTFVKSNDQLRDTYASITEAFLNGDTNYGFPLEGLSGKFTILKQFKLLQNTQFGEIPLDFSIPVQFIRTRWNGTAATDIEKNGIYLFIQSNTTSNHPTLALNEALRYYDA